MFETCASLEDLNRERQRLVQSGVSPMTVNRAYNRAKKELLDTMPAFRHIPRYTGKAAGTPTYCALPILPGKGNPNEIVITPEGVLL